MCLDISADLVFNEKIIIMIDLFLFYIYTFLTDTFRKNKEDAKFSSILVFSLIISFLVIDIILFLGLVYDNKLSQAFIEGGAISNIIIMIIIAIIFIIRYYRCINIEDIKIRALQVGNATIMKILLVLFIITIPICYFVFFRFYKYGYIIG